MAENAENLQSLSYSRKFEDEADTEGVRLMMHNKVHPRGMINLFRRLKDEKYVVPEFLSTHPITDGRIQTINRVIKESQFLYRDYPKLKQSFELLKKQ
ncbi:MAG: M48 family metalloprotease [Paludibacter sp.]|nr:M48 family metalloprotease [Paludibacter sp.]